MSLGSPSIMWPIGHLDRGFASLLFSRFAVSVLFANILCSERLPKVILIVLFSYMPKITPLYYSCYTKI